VTDLNDILQQQNGHAVRNVLDDAKPYRNGHTALQDRLHEIEMEVALELICAAGLLSRAAREREWLARDVLPKNEVTLFSGDGGVGKSTIALQLATAGAIGTRWIGYDLPAVPFRTLILSAEDDRDEVHWRLQQIIAQDCPFSQEDALRAMEAVFLIDATRETDPLLATYDPKKGVRPTPLYHAIKKAIREKQIDLFVIDSAADVFSEERERHAVRSFIRLLRSLGCTVLLLAHPSVDAMRSGRGYSGSTHWNNSVRSRLYLTKATASDDSEPDPDLRVLELAKANRGQSGRKITLRWQDGRFIEEGDPTQSLDGFMHQLEAERVFFDVLREFNRQGQNVSSTPSARNYAPKSIATHPNAEGYTKNHLERAMQALLSADKIEIEDYGPPSRRFQRLIVKGEIA